MNKTPNEILQRIKNIRMRLSQISPYPYEVILGRVGGFPRVDIVSKSDTRNPKKIIAHIHFIAPDNESNPNWNHDINFLKDAPTDIEWLLNLVEENLTKKEGQQTNERTSNPI